MTDEQIVRTLAEFMGRKVVPAANGSCWWFIVGDEDYPDIDPEVVDYLTSYDALAPVWRTLGDRGGCLYGAAMRELTGRTGGCCFCDWFQIPPRGHAEALATAILSAKGERVGD